MLLKTIRRYIISLSVVISLLPCGVQAGAEDWALNGRYYDEEHGQWWRYFVYASPIFLWFQYLHISIALGNDRINHVTYTPTDPNRIGNGGPTFWYYPNFVPDQYGHIHNWAYNPGGGGQTQFYTLNQFLYSRLTDGRGHNTGYIMEYLLAAWRDRLIPGHDEL
jgi:hypothetical protein